MAKRKSFSQKVRHNFLMDGDTGRPIMCSRKGCGCMAEHIHHATPVCEGGTDQPSNLLMLCRDCHVELHSERGDFKAWGAKGGQKTARSMKSMRNMKQFRGVEGEARWEAYCAKRSAEQIGAWN